MLFSSMTFIYVFLPIVLLLYLITKKELHNLILLLASIVFYAWGEPKYLIIMLLTILVNYIGAIAIEKFNYKKLLFISTILLNLGILIYFKYFNFLIITCNNIFHSNISVLDVIMPIGISFYIFHAMSYVIDVFRGEVKAQKNIYKIALYIALFPQLIAGPIVKYHDIVEQIENRDENFEKVYLGVQRFIIGLSKKVLIANTLGAIADKIFVQDPYTIPHSIAWLGSVAYTLQLYFDFSGYSDMAIGLGLIFGFKFMENFNYPFISKSVTEYWRRWHISLSSWFRDYLFYPITRSYSTSDWFSKLNDKMGRKKASIILSFISLMITWGLVGFWHGAEWTFLIYGLYNGFFLFIEVVTKWNKDGKTPFVRGIQHLYTILVALFGLVIFRADNMNYAWNYLLNMFGFLSVRPEDFLFKFSYYIGNMEIITFIVAILCCIPVFKNMLDIKNKWALVGKDIWLLILFFLSTITIASNTYNPFIYFRF